MRSTLISCALALGIVASVSAADQTPQIQIPDTPQGKRVAAYVEAFRLGDEAKMKSWVHDNFADAIQQKRTPEERLATYRRMRQNFGDLDVQSVSSKENTVVLAVNNKAGEPFRFTFLFEPTAPYKVTGLKVEDE